MPRDQGAETLFVCLEAAMIVKEATDGPTFTYTMVDEDAGPMIVHVEGCGRYQVEITREA
jgi:hypothetical protein